MSRIGSGKLNIVKAILFIAVTVLIMMFVCELFEYAGDPQNDSSRSKFKLLHSMKDDTLDVVAIGSSGFEKFIIPAMMWEKDGISCLNFSSSALSTKLFMYDTEEVLKTQNPDVIIFEMKRFARGTGVVDEGSVIRVTDNMYRGVNRNSAIKSTKEFVKKYDYFDIENESSWNIPFLRNHWRWEKGQLGGMLRKLNHKSQYLGYPADTTGSIWNCSPAPEPEFTYGYEALDPGNEEVLEELLDYCDTLDAEVLFVAFPYSVNETNYNRVNQAEKEIKKRGFKTLNFNNDEIVGEMGLDFSKDYYNDRHTNILGAAKCTMYLEKYLKENYNLKDHRGDDDYSLWEGSYEKLEKRIKEMKPEYLKTIRNCMK